MRPLFLLPLCLTLSPAFLKAADLPKIPLKPIGEKGELLFSDDFESSKHDPRWHREPSWNPAP